MENTNDLDNLNIYTGHPCLLNNTLEMCPLSFSVVQQIVEITWSLVLGIMDRLKIIFTITEQIILLPNTLSLSLAHCR